jgi:hypothetical protein
MGSQGQEHAVAARYGDAVLTAIAIAAVATAAAAVASVVLGLFNRKKLTEIHVLVNSRLDQAISEINDLKAERDKKRADDNKGNNRHAD